MAESVTDFKCAALLIPVVYVITAIVVTDALLVMSVISLVTVLDL